MAKKVAKAKTPATPVPAQFLFGFIDADGATKIPAKFDMVGEFEGDHARAKKNGKWGVINASGDWVFEPSFDFLGKIEGGFVAYRIEKLWGIADLSGKEILPAKFDEIVSITPKVVTVRQGPEFSILTTKGETVAGGLVRASRWNHGVALAVTNDGNGLIDENGKWVVPPRKENIYDVCEGLAAFEEGPLSGYYDATGKVALPPQFDAAYDFSEGLARIRKGDKFGYIDTAGKIVIPCEWADPVQINFSGDSEGVTAFKNGFAKTARLKGSDYLEAGFIDRTGKWYGLNAFPENPMWKRPLKSVRLDNPEYLKYQEELDLGPAFQKMLDTYTEKLKVAREKDAPAASKIAKQIMSDEYGDDVAFLKMIIYDMNNHGLVVMPANKDGEEMFSDGEDAKEILPMKTIHKLSEGSTLKTPKSSKGLKLLNEFMNKCAWENLEWFADIWKAAGGDKFKVKAYIQNEDGGAYLDLKTKKRIAEEDLSA